MHFKIIWTTLEFDMKYHILHDFGTAAPFKEKSSNHSIDVL